MHVNTLGVKCANCVIKCDEYGRLSNLKRKSINFNITMIVGEDNLIKLKPVIDLAQVYYQRIAIW